MSGREKLSERERDYRDRLRLQYLDEIAFDWPLWMVWRLALAAQLYRAVEWTLRVPLRQGGRFASRARLGFQEENERLLRR